MSPTMPRYEVLGRPVATSKVLSLSLLRNALLRGRRRSLRHRLHLSLRAFDARQRCESDQRYAGRCNEVSSDNSDRNVSPAPRNGPRAHDRRCMRSALSHSDVRPLRLARAAARDAHRNVIVRAHCDGKAICGKTN
jgi:hypothetical protein